MENLAIVEAMKAISDSEHQKSLFLDNLIEEFDGIENVLYALINIRGVSKEADPGELNEIHELGERYEELQQEHINASQQLLESLSVR